MKALLALIKKLYGLKALSKTIGTRTNVITLPDKDTKRFITNELNIEAASDAAAKKAFEDAEKLIPDIPKMNDQEILTFTGNLQRLDNKLNPPSAEIVDIGTKQPVTGIKQLETEGGIPFQMGDIKGTASADELFDMITKNPYRSGGPLDPNVGIVRTAARQILRKRLDAGEIDIPDAAERDAIAKGYQGGVDPIEVFRKRFGEDALQDLDEIANELNRAGDFNEIDKILKRNKLFDIEPQKNYGYQEGSMTDEELRQLLKSEEPKVIPADSPEGKEITEALIGKPKATVTALPTADNIIASINKMEPMDGMKEVNKVLKKEGKYKNISDDDAKRIVEETEDVIFERNIPEEPEDFATGGRVGMAKGGITALKALLNFFAKQRGKKGSDMLKEINPKRLGFLENLLMKSDKEMLDANRQEYLEDLSDIIKSDKKLLDTIKEMPADQQSTFFRSVNEGGNKGRLDVYRDPNFNIEDAIGEIEQMKKNLKFKDVPEEEVKRQLNASGGVAYLMGL